MKKLICVLLFLNILAGCRQEAKEAMVVSAMDMEALPPPPALEDKDKLNSQPENAGNEEAYPSQKVIKNANIRFETDNLSATAGRIQAATGRFRAQVQQDSEGKDDYALSRTITVRVTSKSFEAFVREISAGVSYFDRKEISSQDVTEEYVDTEARLKAKKTLEARYLSLIGKAKKVSEILEIEKELSAIREEIEAQEGRLRYMQNRVSLSTVTIDFYKKTALEPGATTSYGSKMGTAIASGFNGLSSFFIGLLYIWPFILIFVIAFIIVRKKILKRKK